MTKVNLAPPAHRAKWAQKRTRFDGWSGLCPAGLHGLDFEGQECDRCAAKEFATLIERSSIGAALRDIKQRGLEAHLKDLERDLDKPWRRK